MKHIEFLKQRVIELSNEGRHKEAGELEALIKQLESEEQVKHDLGHSMFQQNPNKRSLTELKVIEFLALMNRAFSKQYIDLLNQRSGIKAPSKALNDFRSRSKDENENEQKYEL